MSKEYKTNEFYSKLGDVVREFTKTSEGWKEFFAARASGELPSIFAEDADQHLERQREQLAEWTRDI